MENFKSIFRKLLFLLVLPFLYMLMVGPSQLTNATSDVDIRNAQLLNENYKLKRDVKQLENKMAKIEDQLQTVTEYNNSIYTKMLGVDFDTTDFHKYRNDSARSVFREYDSVFHTLNDRMIYASEMLALQLKKVRKTSNLFKYSKNAIYYYPNISPIRTNNFITLSSPFGIRKHPISGDYLFHEGVDISARPNTNVYSTAQGTVMKVMYSKYGYGNRVVIKHKYGFETIYAHLDDDILVEKGQWVKKNQKIATVGNTGSSTGPHLHYEIHKNGEFRDPLGYFYTHITNKYLANK